MPDFSDNKPRRKRQVAVRELLVANIGGRVTMAQRGASSIRAQFHNKPVELPPPSTTATSQVMSEHSYA